jgi:hypothetical protein
MVRVLRPVWGSEDEVELKVEWFLRSGFNMNIRENITIKKEQFENWYEMETV